MSEADDGSCLVTRSRRRTAARHATRWRERAAAWRGAAASEPCGVCVRALAMACRPARARRTRQAHASYVYTWRGGGLSATAGSWRGCQQAAAAPQKQPQPCRAHARATLAGAPPRKNRQGWARNTRSQWPCAASCPRARADALVLRSGLCLKLCSEAPRCTHHWASAPRWRSPHCASEPRRRPRRQSRGDRRCETRACCRRR